jgi:hypothetical protein
VNAILISWPQITNVSEMDQLLGNSQDLERSINNCEHIFHITATITNVLEKKMIGTSYLHFYRMEQKCQAKDANVSST